METLAEHRSEALNILFIGLNVCMCIVTSHMLVKQDVRLHIALLIKTLCLRHIVKVTLIVYFTYYRRIFCCFDRIAQQHHWLLPINCHFRDCKARYSGSTV